MGASLEERILLFLTLVLSVSFLRVSGAACPGNSTASSCYMLVEQPLSRDAAQEECRRLGEVYSRPGSSLACPSTKELDEDLSALLKAVYNSKDTDRQRIATADLWLGGYEESALFGYPDYPVWRVLEDLRPIFPQGCFGDRSQDRDLAVTAALSSTNMNVSVCTNYCRTRGYKFAGLQRGQECYCGDSYGRHGATSGCTVRCTGSEEFCGGNSQNFIYNLQGDAAFGNWAYQQPNNFDNYQACGALESRNQWKMGDEKCFNTHYYICHLNNPSCPNSNRYQTVNGKCLYYAVDSPRSWFQARADCRARSGELVTISNKAEWNTIKNKLNTLGLRTAFVWIGLIGKRWLWQDNAELIYTNWDPIEPDMFRQNCMKSHYEESVGRYWWKDEDCTKKLHAVCRLGPPLVQETSTTQVTTTLSRTTGSTFNVTTSPTFNDSITTGELLTTTARTTSTTTTTATSATSTTFGRRTKLTTNPLTAGPASPLGGVSTLTELTTTTTPSGVGSTGSPSGTPSPGSPTATSNPSGATGSGPTATGPTATTGAGTTGAPPNEPSAGASTGTIGGFTITELVLLIVLGVILVVAVILFVCCFCYYKKSKEERTLVYPDKSADVRNQVLVPYGDYYGNHASSAHDRDNYGLSQSYGNDTYGNFYNANNTGGVVLNANNLNQDREVGYLDYKPSGLTRLGSRAEEPEYQKERKKKKRSKRYAEQGDVRGSHHYETLPEPRGLTRIALDD